MPPKSVYGKRANATVASRAKFLSPDKDDLLHDKPKCKVIGKSMGKEEAVVVAIDAVEQRLEALTIQDEPVVVDVEHVRKAEEKTQKAPKTKGANIETKKKGTRGQRGRPATRQTKEPQANSHVIDAPELVDPNSHEPAFMPSPSRTPRRIDSQKLRSKVQQETKNVSLNPMRSLPTPHRAPSPNDIFTDYVSPLLSLSDRRAIISFEQWSSELDPYFEVTKIAEASFGEVYRLTVKSAMPNSPSESVLKIMAMRSPPDAPLPSNRDEGKRTRRKADAVQEKKREKAAREEKDQWKSYVDQIQSEVQLLQNLNPIPGFTNFRELTVLKGRPSLSFSNAWRTWNRSRPRSKKSVFPDPSKKTSYDDTQLWAVVEMQDAGTDCERLMERGGISTIWEVWDVFWGVCLSVAKAEEGCRFEHRDLHLENVCIRSSQSIDDISSPVVKNPLKRKLGFTSLETTVIDYTLSRADIINTAEPHIRRPGSSSSLSSRCSSLSRSSSDEESFPGPSVAYFDLNKDVSIFSADASEEYQYEIYRYMRSIAFYDDPTVQVEDPLSNDKNDIEELEEYSFETPRCSPRKNPRKIPRKTSEGRGGSEPPKDIWKQFHPKTNLVWIHFILYKLLQHINDNLPSAIDTVRLIKNVNIDASSASVASLVHKKAVKLERILQRVANRIEPCVLGKPECLGSVGELVVLAIQKGWVDMGDVVGSG